MNRQQKRLGMKDPRNFSLTMNVMKEIERKDATINTIANLSAIFAIVLHDKFGWGKARINRLLNNVVNQADCCNAGTVSMDDILKWALEYGIEIELPIKR